MTCFLILALWGLAEQPDRNLEIRVIPPEPIQGQIVLVELNGTSLDDEVEGSFGAQKLRFFLDDKRRHRALAAVRLKQDLESISVLVEVTPPGEDPIYHGMPVMIHKRKVELRTLKVASKYIRPPKKVRERIRAESQAIGELWGADVIARAWRGSFVLPLKGEITSPFGVKRKYNRKLVRSHYGVDIDGKTGDPLLAVGAGTVVMATDLYYSGGTVIIDHGLKLFSLYYHLSEFTVQPGEQVKKGQLIGKVGRSGRVTGPHLHLGTKLDNVNFDPLSLMKLNLNEKIDKRVPEVN